jgi:hypothetical protein
MKQNFQMSFKPCEAFQIATTVSREKKLLYLVKSQFEN